jgi:prepilin-type N-terminal cleavage/methylation domain-containing protein
MLKRAGLTLLEVLIAIFIMGIGMLSVLAMYPAAAEMMGRAISNSQLAEGLVNARAMDDGVDWTSSAYSKFVNVPIKNTGAMPGWFNQPAGETPAFLLLDQYAALSGVYRFSQLPVEIANLNSYTTLPGPPPTTMAVDPASGNPTQPEIAGRFFTCNSDVVLNKAGQANKDDDGLVVPVDREGKFTIVHFYTKAMPISYPSYVRKQILLFKDRSQSLSANDFSYFDIPVSNVAPVTQFTISNPGNIPMKTRQWIMVTNSLPVAYPTALDFFEIQSVDDSSAGALTLEISQSLNFSGKSVYLLKDVVRVALIGS